MHADVATVGNDETAPPRRTWPERHHMGLTATVIGFAVGIALWIRYWSELRTPTYPIGDLASDGLMVQLAHQFELNHGHYSQFSFFHPGAAMFYVESGGQTLFHDWFHLFPNAYDASWATVLLVNAALIGASAFCLGVAFASRRVIVASAVGFLVFALLPTRTFAQAKNGLLVESWIPIQTIWCVLFLLCALIYLLGRKRSAFLMIGIAATWMAQRYIILAPVGIAALAGGWIVAWRTSTSRNRGRDLTYGIAAVVVLSLPNILGILLDWPWQLSNYAHAATHPAKSPRTLGQALGLVASFWGIHHTWVFAVLFVAGLGVAYAVYLRADSVERTGYLVSIALVYVGTLLALVIAYTVDSTVDDLHAYELSFYLAIVALGYAIVAMAVLRWWLGYALLPVLLAFGDFGSPPALGYVDMPTAQRAVVTAAGGKQIEYVAKNSDNWIWIAGLLLTDVQSGVRACAVSYDSQSAFVYAPQNLCPTRSSTPVARFLVNPGVTVPGGQTIYTSGDLDIVKLPS